MMPRRVRRYGGGAGDAFNQAVKTQTAQIAGHSPLGQLIAEQAQQGGEAFLQFPVGEAAGSQRKAEKGGHEGLHRGLTVPQPAARLANVLPWPR